MVRGAAPALGVIAEILCRQTNTAVHLTNRVSRSIARAVVYIFASLLLFVDDDDSDNDDNSDEYSC